MPQVGLVSFSLQDILEGADTADISPASGLRGFTLIDPSSSANTDLDFILLGEAEELDVGADKQGRSLSPFFYYDDLDIEEIGYQHQWLIEAAEMEDMASKTENREMSPTAYFETPSSPSEKDQVASKASLRSSHSSLESPFSPTKLVLGRNENEQRSTKAVESTELQQTKTGAELRHPFVDAMTEPEIIRSPLSTPSQSSDRADEDQIIEDARRAQTDPGFHQPAKSTLAGFHTKHPSGPVPNLVDARCPTPDQKIDSAESLRRPKRSQVPASLNNDQGKFKRLRFDQDVFEIPASPETSESPLRTFSTATTAVNSEPGSPNLSASIDYTRVMQIIMSVGGMPVKYTCHEHKLFQISGFVREYRNVHPEELITLHPQDKVHGVKVSTIHQLIHWLYNNHFTEPEGEGCSFRELLDMYFLAHAYAITVLKNVVIDHLIDKCSLYFIPARHTKRIYRYTEKGDQLRRLWVDIYVWEVGKDRFRGELNSGALDPTFLQDLALAQMNRIRVMQKKTGRNIPPYEKSKSAYHRRDEGTGLCCRRKQYEGEGYYHRDDYDQENANLKNKLEKLHSKLEALKREESENTTLKRNLQRMQLKLNKAEMRVMRHVSIDHSKLWKSCNYDNPEIAHPELLRKENGMSGLQN